MALMDDRVIDDRINNCPHCDASLIGDPIPEEYRVHKDDCDEQKANNAAFAKRMNEQFPHHPKRSEEGQCFCLPYGEATHWRREIGHEIQGVYDGILFYTCPDCGWAWNRWVQSTDRLHQIAALYVEENNSKVTSQ